MSDRPDRDRPDRDRPVLFEIDDDPSAPEAAGPGEAPPVPDPDGPPPEGRAMTVAAALAARQPSRLARWFWRLLGALLLTVLSVAAWAFVASLMAAYPLLGWLVGALFALFALVCVLIAIKEVAAIARLGRIDALHREAEAVRAGGDLAQARRLVAQFVTLYAGRDDTRWGRDRLAERQDEVFDAEALLALAERELMAPLDTAAKAEVMAAARQVAAVTAVVPLAFADVAAAFVANLRMIRRIAEIYGGRSGTLGALRLTRAVFAHLVATGAVAAGDDMLEPILGGGLLARVSRRFGEGVVNGALTARVGVAAMEVCRPLPFAAGTRPSVRSLVVSSLSGLFDRKR